MAAILDARRVADLQKGDREETKIVIKYLKETKELVFYSMAGIEK